MTDSQLILSPEDADATALASRANDSPGVGLHFDIPAVDYHRWPGASNSRLMELSRSPKHARHKMDNPESQTPAMILGTAFHLLTMEPEKFPGSYAIAKQCVAVQKNGKQCQNPGKLRVEGTWYCGVHTPPVDADPQAVLSSDDYDTIHRMRDAVMAHPAARALIEAAKNREVSGVWNCSVTGVLCKLRADMLCDGISVIGDLKTTEDASRRGFTRSIDIYGYHFQGGMYTSGLADLGMAFENFCPIAVEKAPPYGVAVYRMRDDVLDASRDEVIRRLRLWKKCEESGNWPAYPDEIQDIGVSDWALHQLIEI